MAGPQKTPLSPAPSSTHSPSPHLGPSPRTPSHSLLSLHAPGLTSHTVESGDSPAMWRVDWGQEDWQRQARLGVSHSHASACLGFCICKMGTVALAPSCRCPRGARRPLALPRLLLASPSVRDGRWPCLLQVLSGTVLALGRDGNPLPPSCPHAATWAGRRGTSRVFHPSPPRPECGSMASSPTSERLLTAPAPCPVPWPVAPPRPAPAGAPAH